MSDILSNMDRDFGEKTAGSFVDNASNANGVYEPRRSARVNPDTSGDGDTWQEKLMVCEAAGNKLVIRSYFRSNKGGQRVWDEPPTGASRIEPASAADRQKAEEELKNLQIAMDINSTPADDKKSTSSKKAKGFFSVFRKKKDKANETSSSGGMFGKTKKNNKVSKGRSSTTAHDTDADEDLQRAISLSMGITPGTGNEASSPNRLNESNSWQAEEEALEMAKAISMSEAEASKSSAKNDFTEDEMLQRAIDESRRQTTEVASMPGKESELFGLMDNSSSHFNHQPIHTTFSDDSDFLNQKMPAKSKPEYDKDFFNQTAPDQIDSTPSPSTSTSAYTMFDPYANNSNSSPAAAAVAAAGVKKSPPDEQQETSNSQGLRKMESPGGGRRSTGMGIGIRFGKKHLEDDAGIV